MHLVPIPLKRPSRRRSSNPPPQLPHPLLKWLHLGLWLLLLWLLQPLQHLLERLVSVQWPL